MKLLVADSDADLVEMLTSWLRTRGYQVRYALTAERIRSEWVALQPDLVIVGIGLKGAADELALCRELRDVHDALVLALTSASSSGAEIQYLESGADACLGKPFLPGQLLAHIHALSRRVRNTLLRSPSSILAVGPLRIDALRNEVGVEGKVVRLTPTESKLLHLLAVNANDVCTLEQIVAHVWGYGDESDTTLVKAHIRHLREKIERDPSEPLRIVTVAGSGYMLVRQPQLEQQVADAPSATVSAAGADADELSGAKTDTGAVPTTTHHQAPSSGWQELPEPMWHPAPHGTVAAYSTGIHTAG